ncbi:Phosphoglycerate kinase [Thermodesulfobacterium geofontis OPF15]|jgi:phosphoglycerate kinase|uniref:Phosphoglycerate kinase n=1 Tax=Thermodesulfobacterium geofontis (strain OPF15) TaxID=795359 RepID=F8C263_THEGP|nr:phosphoglycerate kinase [Thermodesulfobacterium geofontis]AEH22221.1 Phosphoglycerate kinase [Thermodesulfobacterium geofontis OPF15]
MKTLSDFDLKGKKVFIRVDFNVPMENGKITDDTRIVETLPTINYVVHSFGKVILCSHLGRPKGRIPEYSLKPVYEYLKKVLKAPVKFLEDIMSEEANKVLEELKEGEVLLLENIRFYEGETKNDLEFAKILAKFADIFINDAFSVCHRNHASVVGVPQFVSEKGIGFQMEKELKYLSKIVGKPERPFYAIVGGSKVSTKIGVLKNLLNKVDKLIIGGVMANTFLAAKGYSVGESLLENDYIGVAKQIMKEAKDYGVKIYLPVDVVVERNGVAKKIELIEILKEDKIYDIGESTIKLFSQALEGANTLVWNGPLGYFEKPPFHKGTVALARKIAALPGTTIAGGGDTILAIKLAGVETSFSYISTAGGAFLEYLEGKELPGLKVLKI